MIDLASTLLIIFAILLFAFVISLIFYIGYDTPENVKKEIENEDKEVLEDIKKIEDIFTKTLAEDNSPVINFFIKAFLKNFRYVRMKEHYIERDEELAEYVVNRKEYKRIYKKNLDYLYNSGKPVYSDIMGLTDPEVARFYSALSLSYKQIGLKLPRIIQTHHNVDLSDRYFFYTKVGNLTVPQFVSSKDKSKRLYIYPTVAIAYDKKGKIDITDLVNVNVRLKDVKGSDTPMSILSIDLMDIEIITGNVEAARNFYNVFLYLQKYENEKDWGLNNQDIEESNKEIQIKGILKTLDKLVGLRKVKTDFYKTADYIKIQQIRKFKGLKAINSNYHYVFTGNPGTGKTTVARLLAQIYKEMGIVKTGHLIETDRSGLVAEYVGQTAVKTNNVIDKAIGGVLFIDEAYSLVNGQNDDFGNEAVSTLLKRMEDDRDKFVVIIAGYTDEMKKFIETNPGLQSRFTRTFNFEDYSAEELIEIYERMVKENDYVLSDEASAKVRDVISQAVVSKDKNFGNARFIRNMFEDTLQNQAARLSQTKDLTHALLQTILSEDIPM